MLMEEVAAPVRGGAGAGGAGGGAWLLLAADGEAVSTITVGMTATSMAAAHKTRTIVMSVQLLVVAPHRTLLDLLLDPDASRSLVFTEATVSPSAGAAAAAAAGVGPSAMAL